MGSGTPAVTVGPPPCIFSALTVATSTTALGIRPEALHLMLKNFSIPMSAPNPASVTKKIDEKSVNNKGHNLFKNGIKLKHAHQNKSRITSNYNFIVKLFTFSTLLLLRSYKNNIHNLPTNPFSPTSFNAILSAIMEEFPWAMFAKGPACTNTGVPWIHTKWNHCYRKAKDWNFCKSKVSLWSNIHL